MEKKSKIINKFAATLEKAKSLFSKEDSRKYGEIVVVNDVELPEIVIMAQDGELSSIHGTKVSGGTDMEVVSSNVEKSEEFLVSHAEINVEIEKPENDENTFVSDIVPTATGHITKIVKKIIPQQRLSGVTVDGVDVVNESTQVAEISFNELVKRETYDLKIKEIDDNITGISQTIEDNEKVTSASLNDLHDSIEGINEQIKTGIKNPEKLTIDGIPYDGSKKVEIDILKNTAGVMQYPKDEKMYLIGGETGENIEYGQTYTDEYVYVRNGSIYSKYTTKDADGNDVNTSEEVATKPYVSEEIAKVIADAPESYDTLKEIADYISTDTTNAANVAVAISNLTTDNVIGRGNVEKSAILKGMNNIAASPGSVALGNGSFAGISGYYINAINTTNNTIWLTNETGKTINFNPSETLIKTFAIYDGAFVSPYSNGDVLTVKLFNDFEILNLEIENVSGNKITFVADSLNQIVLTATTYNAVDDEFTVYSINKPSGGNYTIGEGAFAEGKNTKAYGPNSHAAGIGTQTYNEGEFAVGKFNKSIESETLFSVGVGSSDVDRKNAFEVKNGEVYILGDNYTTQVKELIKELQENKSDTGHTHDPIVITGGTDGQLLVTKGETSKWVSPTDVKVQNATTAENANTANALATARNISVNNAVSATGQKFDGNNDITIPINSVKEAYLEWGGKSISGDVSPIDFASTSMLNGNKLAFGNAEGIVIEYSQDGGTTWFDYESSDEDKIKFVSGLGANFSVGKRNEENTVDDKLRITFDASILGIYTSPVKLLLNISTNYAQDCTVDVDYALFAEPTSFKSEGTYGISGWSGWNSIPLSKGMTFGGGNSPSTQRQKIRLTFNIGGVSEDNGIIKGGLSVLDIVLLGTTNWVTPSEMARTGHMYSYDADGNVVFPNDVSATTFNGYNVEDFLVNTDSATTEDGHYMPSKTFSEMMGSSSSLTGTFGESLYVKSINIDSKKHVVGVNTEKLPNPITLLGDYYKKTETYNKEEIDEKVSSSVASVVTTEDIVIEGGPLADHFATFYEDYKTEDGLTYMPSGVTFTEFVKLLLCTEKWPEETFTEAKYSNSISNPVISANKSGLVEVGTTITFNSVKSPSVSISTSPMTVGGLTYGYTTLLNGNINTGKTITSTVSTTQTSGSYYTISAEQRGFKNGTLPSTVTGTSAPTLEGCSLVAGFGTNTYTVNVSGATYDYSYSGINSVYIVSNLKNTDDKYKTTERNGGSGTMSRATNNDSYRVTGVYPIYTNKSGSTLLDDATSKESLTSASTITIYDIPSEVVNNKNFMCDFPASKTITNVQIYVPGLGLQTVNNDSYLVSNGIVKTINGTNYNYKRFMFTTASNGELDYIKMTFSSNLSIE